MQNQPRQAGRDWLHDDMAILLALVVAPLVAYCVLCRWNGELYWIGLCYGGSVLGYAAYMLLTFRHALRTLDVEAGTRGPGPRAENRRIRFAYATMAILSIVGMFRATSLLFEYYPAMATP